MKYRNHARVRAATRAGEPVPPCARARSGSHASLGRPAGNVLTFSSILHPRGELSANQTILFSSRRFAEADEFLSFSFVAACACALELWVNNLKKRSRLPPPANVRLRMQTYDFRGKRAVTGTTKKIIPLTFPAPRAVVGL